LSYPDETDLNLSHYAISFSWVEHFFGSDSDKLLASAITKEKGHDAYHLIPIYKSIASFIANTQEQKIVHVKYQ